VEPLDEQYLRWLYSQVSVVRLKDPRETYWSLLRLLYKKEFIWLIPNDDNRLEDGRDLRMEFVDQEELDDVDPDWLTMGCSMLEMMIGLSRRLNFEDEIFTVAEWFWELIANLQMRLADYWWKPNNYAYFNDLLDKVVWRTYRRNGVGGLFPLKHPEEDQRDVEIWYQLSAYLLETE
jgi:hypothetical protein